LRRHGLATWLASDGPARLATWLASDGPARLATWLAADGPARLATWLASDGSARLATCQFTHQAGAMQLDPPSYPLHEWLGSQRSQTPT